MSSTYKVKPIDIGLLDPRFKAISDLRGSANEDRTIAADSNMLCNGVFRPLRSSRGEPRIALNGGPRYRRSDSTDLTLYGNNDNEYSLDSITLYVS